VKAFAAVLSSALLLLVAAPALADPYSEPEPARLKSGFESQDRPIGMAEFGVGALTLPGAEVCVERDQGQCPEGDASFVVEAWPLYRPSVRFAFGAGLMLGLIPTTVPQSESSEEIVRDHSRSYLTVEGIGRYYFYVGKATEVWGGLTGGLVVVSDRFVVEDPILNDRALVGPQGVTIRTEGGSVGLAVGAGFSLAESWSLGVMLRYGQWFLPQEPATDPLGSEASLTGRNTYVTLGISIAYRSVL
jgi:hypothetical protein